MGILGNLLWFLLGGWLSAIGWLLVGLFWCITIIGIPVGVQCFKFAGLSAFPFGREVLYDTRPVSLIINILWLIFGGIELAVFHGITGLIFCITIIGIPFGKQHFKLAQLALLPFGTKIR